MTRHFWVLLHRYVGLAMAAFLIMVGLTGSLLAFFSELNSIITPNLFPPPRVGIPLDIATLAGRAEALVPQARVSSVYFMQPGMAMLRMEPSISPATGKPFALNFNQLFLDPISGKELGRREVGAGLPTGWDNLMPFIYRLHFNLALGEFGIWVLGITALLWVIDCFVSFYLTLPAMRRRCNETTKEQAPCKGWWHRWQPAWLLRWKAGGYRLYYDLHRAGGLWLWIALLVFAWSSVHMNLHEQVYAPVTRLIFDYPQQPWERPPLDKPLAEPALGWRQAQETAERLMAEQARLKGLTAERPVSLWIDREHGVYHFSVHSSLDFQGQRGRTAVIFDANTGELKHLLLPSGQHSGSTVTNWLQTLHEANVFGLPYRIFVCALGLAITMLSLTGVIIWLKKRRARLVSNQRRAQLESGTRA